MNAFRRPGFFDMPPVVKNIIIINVLFYLAIYAFKAMGIDLNQILGLYYVQSEYFQPYQFVTHMFMHGGFMHIFFNMYALWMFGKILESAWGSKRFLIYYFVTGIGAAALNTFVSWISISSIQDAAVAFSNTPSPDSLATFIRDFFPQYYTQIYDKLLTVWYNNPSNPDFINQANIFVNQLVSLKMNIPTIGASGAVFGVLLAFGMMYPNSKLMLLIPPIPIKTKYFVIGYGLIELYTGVINQPGDNIAHFAHLGGMLFGFILLKYWGVKKSSLY
ncbi:MAG: rhomboid family intramembrane serine protease [Bacteroidetes bacterium]|nr:rhomboid family intramembrane serine protease [Bacteroidota bacterium]